MSLLAPSNQAVARQRFSHEFKQFLKIGSVRVAPSRQGFSQLEGWRPVTLFVKGKAFRAIRPEDGGEHRFRNGVHFVCGEENVPNEFFKHGLRMLQLQGAPEMAPVRIAMTIESLAQLNRLLSR